jgi:hypothetical protein
VPRPAVLGRAFVVIFVAPSTLHWDVLTVGLAWPAWLLIWVLPSVVASRRQ